MTRLESLHPMAQQQILLALSQEIAVLVRDASVELKEKAVQKGGLTRTIVVENVPFYVDISFFQTKHPRATIGVKTHECFVITKDNLVVFTWALEFLGWKDFTYDADTHTIRAYLRGVVPARRHTW